MRSGIVIGVFLVIGAFVFFPSWIVETLEMRDAAKLATETAHNLPTAAQDLEMGIRNGRPLPGLNEIPELALPPPHIVLENEWRAGLDDEGL